MSCPAAKRRPPIVSWPFEPVVRASGTCWYQLPLLPGVTPSAWNCVAT